MRNPRTPNRRPRPKGQSAEAQAAITRRHPAHFAELLSSIRTVAGTEYYPPPYTIEVMQLAPKLRHLSKRFGGTTAMRVFEVGAGSGRLASHLIKKFGLKPENYIMGDIDYPVSDAGTGPRLSKKAFFAVKRGGMRKLHVDISSRPPDGIGRFHLIIIANVNASMTVIKSVIKNYVPLLVPGGRIVINRFETGKFELTKVENAEYAVDAQISPEHIRKKYNRHLMGGVLNIIKTA